MAKASDNLFPKVILEERLSDGSDTPNPASDHRALFLGEDGALHLRDSAGAVTNIGAATFIGTRCRNSAVQSLTNATFTPINLDTEDYDTDTMHYTSVANLTGTVSKTAASAAIVGVGTSFTTELSVGQLISVPGTAAEIRVVTVITDNTNLTVAATFANTASGQTATRVNQGIVVRTAGYYDVVAQLGFASNSTGNRYLNLQHVRGATVTTVASLGDAGLTGDATRLDVGTPYLCNQWDWFQMLGYQASGGALNTEAAASYSPVLSVTKLG